ncbi:hypothetical protein [Nocardioides mesophilus]|uniref:Uncharacterized protein n=1 Tax=Nocardioides mesophilus TaxID=433659 RepID=A0A7G9RCH5_9ACTN|nr:hypothetical protein [Nocardioides mesophilus]QNN53300.1 hypothetical protein H9L09_02130 [Nocardioides mesophilus]
MNHTARRSTAAAVIGLLAASSSLVATAPSQATTLAPSRVTVQSTDYTPASGQTFSLYGAVWSEGVRVPATVRVKTYRHGEWVQLAGAVMHTNRVDQYRIRIILQMKGERLLRVVGRPDDTGISTARKTITVTVH